MGVGQYKRRERRQAFQKEGTARAQGRQVEGLGLCREQREVGVEAG